jgi:hypothetical protein
MGGGTLSTGKTIDEINEFLPPIEKALNLLVGTFGPWGTVILVALVLATLFFWKVYKDRQADEARNLALAEKERTIQRLANQERTWRRLFMTQVLKLPPDEADKLLLLEGNYENAKEAREAIEKSR